MAIHIFEPKFRTDEILEELRICFDRGWTGLGFKTLEFEEKWKAYTGLANAHFLNSNTAGLHLALHVLKARCGWSDADEVITTPLTFISTNHAILYEDLRPVFADVDEYLCLDPASVEAKITPRTRAVMFVGMGGNSGQWPAVVELCRKRGLVLILDAAHMAGTKINSIHAGQEADAAVFSFQAVKNLPTADAGMVCFRDQKYDAYARKLSWLGINKDTYQRFDQKADSYQWRYDVDEVGFKYHGNSVQAAIALVQIKYLDEDNQRREEISAFYDKRIAIIPGVSIVRMAPGCQSSRYLYQILVDRRDALIDFFCQNEIYPGVHYVDNTQYPMYAFGKGTCPKAAQKSDQLISLPLHLKLTEANCKRVMDVLDQGVRSLSHRA